MCVLNKTLLVRIFLIASSSFALMAFHLTDRQQSQCVVRFFRMHQNLKEIRFD